jgi:hypothetical protein
MRLLRNLLGIATISCASCIIIANDDEYVKGYEWHAIAGDPVVLGATTVDGDTIDFIGTRDANGVPSSILGYFVATHDGHQISVMLDSSGRPTRLDLDDKTTYRLQWLSDKKFVLSQLTDNGATQVSTNIELAGAAPQSSPQSAPEHHVPRDGGGTSTVNVQACAQPVDDAIVRLRGRIDDKRFFEFLSSAPAGSGTYVFPMPTGTMLTVDLPAVCSALNQALGAAAKAAEAIGEGGQLSMCATFAARGALALPAGAPISGPGLFALCEATFKSVVIADKVLNCPNEVPGCLGDQICSKLTTLTLKNGTFDYSLFAVAYNGDRSVESDHKSGNSINGWPSFAINFGGNTAIDAFTATPPAPAASQGYVAKADIGCVATDSKVTMKVSGTDGYMASSSTVENGTISLNVPGGAQGVRDTITVTIDKGPSKTITLSFQ